MLLEAPTETGTPPRDERVTIPAPLGPGPSVGQRRQVSGRRLSGPGHRCLLRRARQGGVGFDLIDVDDEDREEGQGDAEDDHADDRGPYQRTLKNTHQRLTAQLKILHKLF